MKKNLHNERGYTLLLTLVLITVVILLFTTFTINALSQQKQVEKTDNTYEVTAIAEMGVEYYKVKILNAIKTSETNTQSIINNPDYTAEDKTSKITKLYNDLKTSLLSFKTDEPPTTNTGVKVFLEESNSKSFYLKGSNPPKITVDPVTKNSILEIEVVGKVRKDTKSIIAKFNFPNSIANSKTISTNPNDTIGSPKTFPELIKKPIFPVTTKAESILECKKLTNITEDNIKTCFSNAQDFSFKSESLQDIKNLNLYYHGISKPNNLNQNFNFLNNLYVNHDLIVGNLKPKQNSSYYVSGNTTIETIDFKENHNLRIWSNMNLTLKSLNTTNNFDIYAKNKVTFNSSLSGNAITIYANDIEFNQNSTFGNITNSQLQINNSAIFNEVTTINNTDMLIKGSVYFNGQNPINISGDSELLINKIVFGPNQNKNNVLKLQETTKLCLREYDVPTFEMIQTTANSKLYVIDKGILLPKHTQNQVHIVSEDVFYANCKFSSGSTNDSSIIFEPNEMPTKDNIISEVVYQ